MAKRKKKEVIEEDFDDGLDEEPEDEITETDAALDESFDDNLNDNLGLMDDWGMGTQMPMEKHSDLLKELTNFNKFMNDKVNGWLGFRWDEEAKIYIDDPDIEAIMNKKCAMWCIDFLKTYTRGNNILTHINENAYNNIVQDIIDVVWLDIGTRPEDFDLHNDADLHKVCVELEHAAELVLMGAGDGKYTQFLSQSTQRVENLSFQGQQPLNNPYGMPMAQPPRKVGWFGKMKKKVLGG